MCTAFADPVCGASTCHCATFPMVGLGEQARDWAYQCMDYEDPPKKPKCRECRFSCQAYKPGKEMAGPWLCLFEAMDDPAGHASAVVIDPDDAACEGFDD